MRPQNEADQAVIVDKLRILATEIAVGAIRVTWFTEDMIEFADGSAQDQLKVRYERA